jgi:hypothetical protein
MGRHQAVPAEQAAWRAACERPARPQWHLLGLAVRCAMARSAGEFWAAHDVLQSLRSLAQGWRVGPSAWANIPPKRNRTEAMCFSPYLYRARNLVERFFNKIKHCRRVTTRYDKLAANYLAFVQLASIRLWLRVNESTT